MKLDTTEYLKTLDGTYDLGSLDRLKLPAAWEATVPDEDKDACDAARRKLASDAKPFPLLALQDARCVSTRCLSSSIFMPGAYTGLIHTP